MPSTPARLRRGMAPRRRRSPPQHRSGGATAPRRDPPPSPRRNDKAARRPDSGAALSKPGGGRFPSARGCATTAAMTAAPAPNRLYYGDNLEVLRDTAAFPDASVDLVYLDPPFNSNAGYNVLFKSAQGSGADASIEAFGDTWTWGPSSSAAMLDIASGTNRPLTVMMQARRALDVSAIRR